MTSLHIARIGVDIGGTFTDVALEIGLRRFQQDLVTVVLDEIGNCPLALARD